MLPYFTDQMSKTNQREIKKYKLLDKAKLEQGNGGIVCMCQGVIPIDSQNCFIPCHT